MTRCCGWRSLTRFTTPVRATTARKAHRLWERFAIKTARDQLWYYDGLVEFFAERRPGPLAEDLRRAVDELATLVGHDEAQHATDE